MSKALWAMVEDLSQRLTAVEVAQAAAQKLAAIEAKVGANRAASPALAVQAEQRHLASLALRSEIQAIMATHSGQERLTAKRICKLLGRDPAPKERTVMDHMKEIDAASAVPRS